MHPSFVRRMDGSYLELAKDKYQPLRNMLEELAIESCASSDDGCRVHSVQSQAMAKALLKVMTDSCGQMWHSEPEPGCQCRNCRDQRALDELKHQLIMSVK